MPNATQVESRRASGITAGLVLVVIGLVLLGDQLDLTPNWHMRRLWPAILVAVGVGNALGRETRAFGVWMLFVGGLFLGHTHRVLSIRDTWPLFIVAFGVALLIGAWSGRTSRTEG